MYETPRSAVIRPSVVMSGGILSSLMMKPARAPNAMPSSIATATAAATG